MPRVELFADELWTLEPYGIGYAVLVCTPFLGLSWIFMSNEQVAALLWR
jgi:hypothetical protein